MKVAAIPEQLELLNDDIVPEYLYGKIFAEARQDPFVVLHTSGSTGLPKPVVVPNGSVATTDAQHLLPPVEGRLTQAQFFMTPHKAYSTFPNFHSAGIVFCCALPFFYELSIVMGPALVPVNLDLVNSMLEYADVDGSLLAPSTLEEIANNESSLSRIAKTAFTIYGGGPLDRESGNRINAVTRVFNIMGVTEGSLFPVVQAEREDWYYHHFHPAGGYTYKQRTDELWEQSQTRDPKLDLFQAFLQTFPNEMEVSTKDLYSKHPTKEGRWLYRGRTDDVIVLSNGEKVNPVDMEACVNSHPAVKASLVIGQGRFQTAVLVQLHEPAPTTKGDAEALKVNLWTRIEIANQHAPTHGQIHRDFVLFASEDKPFVSAGKETVLRATTVKLYEKEIEDFYTSKRIEPLVTDSSFDTSSLESIQKGVHDLLFQLLGGVQIALDDDLFVAGLDSLSVFQVLANVKSAIDASSPAIDGGTTATLIYSNPTVSKLSRAIDRLLRSCPGVDEALSTEQLMKHLLEKYTSGLPEQPTSETRIPACGPSVIITGTTGSLGSYLLEQCLSNQNVSRIFCLNRTEDAYQRQIYWNKERGLRTDWSGDRVKFIHTDLSREKFGLDEIYQQILQETTHIVHNQWQVDFNLHLSSFEPHIRGVRHLVDFALQSTLNPSIFFVSSVGVVKAQKTSGSVAETAVTDFSVAEAGYGRSKLVAELILKKASEQSGIPCSVCRLGQIAGPADSSLGMWNKQEWLPSVIASSKYLGMVPSSLSSLDRVDWLPVDHVSSMIIELAKLNGDVQSGLTIPNSGLKIFHGVNPSVCSWASLVPSIVANLGGASVSVVSWTEWLKALESSQLRGDYDQNPGIKLLDFYRSADNAGSSGLSLPVLETKKTQLHSKTLRTEIAVNERWVRQWMKQWGF